MSKHLGDFDTSAVIYGKFTTFRPSTGAAYTLGGTPALSVYKDASTTQSTTGVTLTADFDSVTGLNHFAIDTSADGTFYAAGSFFDIVITTGTVDSVSVVGAVVGSFTLRKNSALKPATAGRTLVVDASGLADANMVKVGPTGSGTAQTAGDIIAYAKARRTIWVAASGGSASGPGTFDAPYNTFANAQTAANHGDTIHLKAGAYSAITISKRLTVVGNSAATTIISDNTTPPMLITSHGVTLRDLQVLNPSKQYTGISASDQYFLTIERCIIDAGFDGIYNSGSIGSRFIGNYISSTYDTVSLIGSIGYTVEGNYIVTDGSYATNIPARAIHAEAGSSGLIKNNTILVARTNAATAESIGVETGYTPGSYSSACLIENNAISVSSTNASATGKCYGIKAKADDTTDRLIATVRGGSISVTNAGATANDEIDIDASVAGSSVFVQGVSYSAAKCLGTANIQELPWSTTPGRSLDITSTGEAGIDWANVGTPSATVALSNTTIDLIADAVDDTSLAASAATEIASAVSSGSNPAVLQTTTIATLATQTSFTLTAGSADNDAYNGCVAIVTDASTSTQKAIGVISDYAGSTKTVTLLTDPGIFTMAAGDSISIVAASTQIPATSASLVDADHTWTFSSPNQITAPRILDELIGFVGLCKMDFTEPLPSRSAISSISSASFANISGTEPTISSTSITSDKKGVLVLLNCTSATANTYTISITVVTTDSQTFTRKGRITIE